MLVNGQPSRTIAARGQEAVEVIDQRLLPFHYQRRELRSLDDAVGAISNMTVRGAPLIGATAAYGMALAANQQADEFFLDAAAERLLATRPTAVNLPWALARMQQCLQALPLAQRADAAWQEAALICDEDVALNRRIAEAGLQLIKAEHEKSGQLVNVLTHCNAGWLGTVDWGTALAPVYLAHEQGIPVHVWVDETRPRNQGASLSCWELAQQGVPHTLIADNTGGHLMQHGQVDMVIVGCDRVTRRGDVCNKIGTYLKALAAKDNQLPFYVALPSPTIDWQISDGLSEIVIEQRAADELLTQSGDCEGKITTVALAPPNTQAANYGFDITPARLVTALITERGIVKANEQDMLQLFPEFA